MGAVENLLCCFPLLLLIGVSAVVAADRHGRQLRALRSSGLRVTGWVVGHDEAQRAGQTTFTPVVAFRDEFGVERHFRMNMLADSTEPPVGSEVPVLFMPGRPEFAMVDSKQAHKVGYKAPLLAGVIFIALALAMAIAAVIRFASRIEVNV